MIYLLDFIISAFSLNTIYSYMIFGGVTCLIILECIVKTKGSFSIQKKYTYNIILVIFLWLYGVLVGIVKDNQIGFIFRNFAGMLLYANYFLLHVTKAKREKLIRTIIYIGVFVCVCVLAARILYEFIGAPDIYYTETLRWLTGKIEGNDGIYTRVSIRLTTESALFPLLAICLYNVLFQKKKKVLYFLIFMLISLEIVWIRSDGYMLAYLVLLSAFLFGMICDCKKNSFHILLLALICCGLLVTIVVKNEFILSLFKKFFTSEDTGNSIRYNQIRTISKEISFLGNGLGATFETVNKQKEFPYAIEVIYLNIIHKFGFMSILYFGLLIKNLIHCIKNIKDGIALFDTYVCVGLMCYIIIAIGNPVLFAPQNVVMHTIALYLLEKSDDTCKASCKT